MGPGALGSSRPVGEPMVSGGRGETARMRAGVGLVTTVDKCCCLYDARPHCFFTSVPGDPECSPIAAESSCPLPTTILRPPSFHTMASPLKQSCRLPSP